MDNDAGRGNFFKFAPSEMSHSAVWAWFLENALMEEPKSTSAAEIGLEFLRRVSLADIPRTGKILTEKPTRVSGNRKGRFDIVYEDQTDTILLTIETKLDAQPTSDQLKAYSDVLTPECKKILLVLGYNFGFESVCPGDWKLIDLNEALQIISKADLTNVQGACNDYWEALKAKQEKYRCIEQTLLGDNFQDALRQLLLPEGAWFLLHNLRQKIGHGRLSHAPNKSGFYWTELVFFDPKDKSEGWPEALFYRVDGSTHDNAYISLKQYQVDKDRSDDWWTTKRQHLDEVRQIWHDSVEKCGLARHLPPCSVRNRSKTYESDVATYCFSFSSTFHPKHVIELFPMIHSAFLDDLENRGYYRKNNLIVPLTV